MRFGQTPCCLTVSPQQRAGPGPPDSTLCAPTTHTPAERDLWYRHETSFKESGSYILGQSSVTHYKIFTYFCQANMKPGFSTYSHYRIRLQGRKRGGHQDTGFRAGTRGRGAQLPLPRERSVSSSPLALPPPASTTVYKRDVDVMWTLDTQRTSEGFRTYALKN